MNVFICTAISLFHYCTNCHVSTGNSIERDTFMSPEEAKEFGIIDKVLAHPMQEENAEADIQKTSNVTTKL